MNIRCRKSDETVVKSVIEEVVSEYKTMMKAEVKAFKNKEVPLTVVVDSHKFLPEFNE